MRVRHRVGSTLPSRVPTNASYASPAAKSKNCLPADTAYDSVSAHGDNLQQKREGLCLHIVRKRWQFHRGRRFRARKPVGRKSGGSSLAESAPGVGVASTRERGPGPQRRTALGLPPGVGRLETNAAGKDCAAGAACAAPETALAVERHPTAPRRQIDSMPQSVPYRPPRARTPFGKTGKIRWGVGMSLSERRPHAGLPRGRLGTVERPGSGIPVDQPVGGRLGFPCIAATHSSDYVQSSTPPGHLGRERTRRRLQGAIPASRLA